MPFDGVILSDEAAALVKGRARLERPNGWRKLGCNSPYKGQFCTILALDNSDAGRRAEEFLKVALGVESLRDVYDWNDAPERTLSEVLSLYDLAIAAAM